MNRMHGWIAAGMLALALLAAYASAVTRQPIAQSAAAQVAIQRMSASTSLAIHTDLASCDALDNRNLAACRIKIPASVTAIAFYECDTADGTYTASRASDGTAAAIATTVAGDWYDFPASTFGAAYIKVVSTGSTGTAIIVVKT